MAEASIKEGEYHPVADEAMRWLNKNVMRHPLELAKITEVLASSALSNNRTAELCLSTLERLKKNEPVSDRYLLALAWLCRDMQEGKQ